MAKSKNETKRCTKCGTEKSLSEFRKKDLLRLSSHCNDCQRAYLRDHYRRNKEHYIQKAKKRSTEVGQENRGKIIEYLSTHPCVDCGESDPRVLEFDHVNGKKQKDIAVMIYDYPWYKVEAEIAKCEIRCANCHRRRTHQSQGWWKKFSRNKPA